MTICEDRPRGSPLSPKFNVDKLAIADGGFFTKMVIFRTDETYSRGGLQNQH